MTLAAAKLLYAVSVGAEPGTIRLARPDGVTAPLLVEIQRGWVHAVHLSPAYAAIGTAPPLGEDRLRVLLKLAESYSEPTFTARAPVSKWGACAPFHPGQVLRNHVDALGPDPMLWRFRLGEGRIKVALPPHATSLGGDERPLCGYLTVSGRTAAEIDAVGLCPPERARRLLAFLDAIGALAYDFRGVASPFAVLDLPDGAPLEDVRRAYRKLAFELHPDRHSNQSSDEKLDFERRFAAVSNAYRRLV